MGDAIGNSTTKRVLIEGFVIGSCPVDADSDVVGYFSENSLRHFSFVMCRMRRGPGFYE